MQNHHAVVAQQRPRVPTGYRFTPTPEELIRFYLNPWVAAGHTASLCPGVVCLADIYAADPDELTSRFAGRDHDGSWYFLCLAQWKGGNQSGTRRMNRTVHGGGTWHGSSKRRPVGRDGFRQGFEYRAPGNQKTVWIMEELVTSLAAATDAEGVKVICKMYHSPRALAVAEEEEANNNGKMVQVVGSKRQHGDQYGGAQGSSYDIASTSQHQAGLLLMNAPAYYAGASSKRPRSLDEEHGLPAAGYSVSMMPPPPPPAAAAEFYYAGTSSSSQQGGAPESSLNWQQQQSMVTVEQDVGGGGEEVPSSVPVDGSADTEEGLTVPPMDYGSFDFDVVAELGWSPKWLPNGEFTFDGVEGGDDEPAT